jgi:hypothetical protein
MTVPESNYLPGGTSRSFRFLLLIPVAYCVLEFLAGPMGFVLGTMCCPELGFFMIRLLPFLPPIVIVAAWAGRRRMGRTLLVILIVTMAAFWLIDVIGLLEFVNWGVSFHHGDLLE